MSESVRETWLNGLKQGDEVAVESRIHGLWIEKVKKRTPTRRIVITWRQVGEAQFSQYGIEKNEDPWSKCHLVQPTQEVRDRIEKQELIRRIGKMKWESCSLETLRIVAEASGKRQADQLDGGQ